jgi:hypothetical protein
MKVLSLYGYFLLPDDFDGTREDALDLFVEYRKTKGYSGNKTGKLLNDDEALDVWSSFLQATETGEYKWTGDINVSQLIDGKMERIIDSEPLVQQE